jgi:hypothetical protein
MPTAGYANANVGFPDGLAARSREVPSLGAHKREEASRSMRRSRIMRDKTARQDSETRQRDKTVGDLAGSCLLLSIAMMTLCA